MGDLMDEQQQIDNRIMQNEQDLRQTVCDVHFKYACPICIGAENG